MNNDLITKSNEIIQNKTNNGTYLQNQVVAALIANKMSNFEEDRIDMQFSLTRNELLDMLRAGKRNGGSQYKTIGDELQSFNQTCVLTWNEKTQIDDEIDERIVSMPFFEELAYYPKSQKIEAKWNKNIIPYLRALSTCYTSYSLTEYLKLGTNHAQVLYELMKSYLGQGYITFDLDDLRNKLGCTKDYYKTFNRFNDKILSKDIKEINENTDITVAITKRIKGNDNKTVKSLLFEIKSKNIKRAWLSEYPTVLLTEKEYSKLFHSELNVNLVKQCMLKLHQYLTENPTTTIRNHYRKIMEYYNAWKDTPQWEQLTFSGRKQKSEQSVCKLQSGRINRQPSYDLEKIKSDTMFNTEIEQGVL